MEQCINWSSEPCSACECLIKESRRCRSGLRPRQRVRCRVDLTVDRWWRDLDRAACVANSCAESVAFVDSGRGFVVGNYDGAGGIFCTTDGD